MAYNDWCNCVTCDTQFVFAALPDDPECDEAIYESQICGVIVLPLTASLPTDWTDAAEWGTLINNSDTSNIAAKYLTVKGGVPVPEKTIVEVAKGVKKVTTKTYTFNGDAYNLDGVTREFLRSLECNPDNYRVWFETLHGNLFGGANGIRPNFTDADLPLDPADDAVELGNVQIEWRSICSPDRAYVPGIVEAIIAPSSQVFAFDENNVWAFDEDNIYGIQ